MKTSAGKVIKGLEIDISSARGVPPPHGNATSLEIELAKKFKVIIVEGERK